MAWFEKIVPSRIKTERRSRSVPEGLWIKCAVCDAPLYRAELERNQHVCPKCGHHMRIGARERLNRFLDAGTGSEVGAGVAPQDPLKFRDSKRYKDRLVAAQKSTGEKDAMVVMAGTLEGMPVVAAAFEFQFLGGSMGSVVGERFRRGVEEAIARRAPFVCFSASGGARMQEALLSLLQMAKTSAALTRLAAEGLPFISVLTDPTTGGVSASLAMLGDLNVAGNADQHIGVVTGHAFGAHQEIDHVAHRLAGGVAQIIIETHGDIGGGGFGARIGGGDLLVQDEFERAD